MKPTVTPSSPNTARTDTLPPIGVAPTDPAVSQMIELIYARRQAIIVAQAPAKRLAASCRKMVAWGEDDVEFPDDCKVVVNKIKQVCLTQASNHLKDPIKATIEPVQTGEYARWYWCGPAEEAAQVPLQTGNVAVDPATGEQQPEIMPGLDPIYIGGINPTTGEPIPPQPLPKPILQQLQQLAQQDEIDPGWFCQLNDEYRAKTAQTILDESWRVAKVDKWAWRTVWAAIVEGWQLPHYEYDVPTGLHMLGRNSIDATYIDQTVEDIDDAAEAGIDLYMDMDEAIAKYPMQEAAIRRWAFEGSMTPSPMMGTVPEQYRGQLRRPFIRKIVWWLRNQPVKLSAEEALNGGHVEQRNAPQATGAAGASVLSGGDGQDYDEANGAANVGGDVSGKGQGKGGGGGMAEQPSPMATTSVQPSTFHLPGTGEQVDPTHPKWPTRLAVRQISIIADAPAGDDWDIECPYGDIPLLHLRNDFVIGKPWGIGEPFGVRNLSKANSRIYNSAVDTAEYNAHEAVEMRMGLAKAMEKEFGEAFVRPDQIIKVPDELWKKDEPSVRKIAAASVSPDVYRVLELLDDTINQIGGRPDVAAGNTPTKNASGQLVAQLSDNAAAPLNFKAQQIVFMFEKLVHLMVECDWKFKPLATLSEITGVPVPLLAMVKDGILGKTPNIGITISTGAGAAIERKRANYVQWNQMLSPDDGLPLVDGRTTREVLSIDPDVSERRSLAAKKRAAAAMGSQQKPPAESINYKDVPPEAQSQMLAQASIQVSPQDLQAHADQQAAQKAAEMQAKAKQNGDPTSGKAKQK